MANSEGSSEVTIHPTEGVRHGIGETFSPDSPDGAPVLFQKRRTKICP